MKRLVLLGEGHGETAALPILVRKILQDRHEVIRLPLYDPVLRSKPAQLVKWDKEKSRADYQKWIERVALAARYADGGGILAVFDGDAKEFPAGSSFPFCAATAAREMVKAASEAGAGKICSLAVVFACVEYETWLIAGLESFVGRRLEDGSVPLREGLKFPSGDWESHGKRWLEKNFPGYRPTRHQSALTARLDLGVVREKNLRSFARLENAIEQILDSVERDVFISTPN